MKLLRCACMAAALMGGPWALSQGAAVSPIDHITINDPRVFDLSDDGTPYQLVDGPVAAAELSLVQGPDGRLTAFATITDDHLNSWGPISLSGRLFVKGTLPLTMCLKGGGSGQAKVKIIGSYDPAVTLMRVVVKVHTPEGLDYQWNDAFIPVYANDLGITIDRFSVLSNSNGCIKGLHQFLAPGSLAFNVSTNDRELINSDFQVKGPGINVIGDFNPDTSLFPVFNCKTRLGYGWISTPGTEVIVTTDNLFPRLF